MVKLALEDGTVILFPISSDEGNRCDLCRKWIPLKSRNSKPMDKHRGWKG